MILKDFNSMEIVRKWYVENNRPKEMEISHKDWYRLLKILAPFQREKMKENHENFDGISVNRF